MRRSGGAGSRTVAMAGLSRRCSMRYARVTCTGPWVTVLRDLAPQTSGPGLLRAGRARDGLSRRRAVEARPRALRGAYRRVRRLHRLRRAVHRDDRRARRPPARRAGPGDGRRAAAGLPRLDAGRRPRTPGPAARAADAPAFTAGASGAARAAAVRGARRGRRAAVPRPAPGRAGLRRMQRRDGERGPSDPDRLGHRGDVEQQSQAAAGKGRPGRPVRRPLAQQRERDGERAAGRGRALRRRAAATAPATTATATRTPGPPPPGRRRLGGTAARTWTSMAPHRHARSSTAGHRAQVLRLCVTSAPGRHRIAAPAPFTRRPSSTSSPPRRRGQSSRNPPIDSRNARR